MWAIITFLVVGLLLNQLLGITLYRHMVSDIVATSSSFSAPRLLVAGALGIVFCLAFFTGLALGGENTLKYWYENKKLKRQLRKHGLKPDTSSELGTTIAKRWDPKQETKTHEI